MADKSLNMSLGTEGLKLIQDFETFQSKLYSTDGGGHCTIGWGHLVHKGKCDGKENEKAFLEGISQEDADSYLKKDTKVAEDAVNQKIGALGETLTQNQFDALVSFTYNVGTGNLANVITACTGSDGKLKLSEIPGKMKLYEKSSGKILAGLTRRRQQEVDLFNK